MNNISISNNAEGNDNNNTNNNENSTRRNRSTRNQNRSGTAAAAASSPSNPASAPLTESSSKPKRLNPEQERASLVLDREIPVEDAAFKKLLKDSRNDKELLETIKPLQRKLRDLYVCIFLSLFL